MPKKPPSKVLEIVEQIIGMKEGDIIIVEGDKNLRGYISRRLTKLEIKGNIVMSLSDGKIHIWKRRKSYTQKLEDLLRRSLLVTDDEDYYTEVIETLGGNNG